MNPSSVRGASFLLTSIHDAGSILTPEGFTDEQRQFARTARQFVREKVLSQSQRLEKKDYALFRQLLKDAAELGLVTMDIPERFGGLGIPDKTTSLLVCEASSLFGAWSVTYGAQTGIGTMPIVWFGTEAQKQKYLPKLASCEWVSAYALTETSSGSDALGAKTKAVLSPDRQHYLLSGSKQFITNAGFADVFIVFAKIDGEQFSAFIVDRNTPGLTVGPEEHKMGIRGSSTCALILENAQVPVENLLGDVGKGHKIAFNILNYGRVKLGVGMCGGMKLELENTLRYAQDRKQFGKPILEFALMREKIAHMATLTYANESASYRTMGYIDAHLMAKGDAGSTDHDARVIAALEEFVIESSILKVFGTEAMGTLADEALQIHGGYGYIEEFPIERAYRDQRINRIFEGTNEINRMLVTGMLLKRSMKGQLPLFERAEAVEKHIVQGEVPPMVDTDLPLAAEARGSEFLKWSALLLLKRSAERFGLALEQQQVLLANITDILMDAFVLESMVLRTRQAKDKAAVRIALTQNFAMEAMSRSYARARLAACAIAAPEDRTTVLRELSLLDGFIAHDPVTVRETIVAAVQDESGYPFPY